ncbi:hypothetical protein [Brevundimonas sp.]|uniref:hypothetical protein n=1 Tax=Brevundimonas sp. TaxID=1871086 RepID=UPI0025BFEB62|nr:hypothetical protein [Brevundimonas sp.]
MKKIYAGVVLAAAIMGVATSSIAGPDCDAPSIGNKCDEAFNDEVLICGFLTEHGSEIAQGCIETARAKHNACMKANSCSG